MVGLVFIAASIHYRAAKSISGTTSVGERCLASSGDSGARTWNRNNLPPLPLSRSACIISFDLLRSGFGKNFPLRTRIAEITKKKNKICNNENIFRQRCVTRIWVKCCRGASIVPCCITSDTVRRFFGGKVKTFHMFKSHFEWIVSWILLWPLI